MIGMDRWQIFFMMLYMIFITLPKRLYYKVKEWIFGREESE